MLTLLQLRQLTSASNRPIYPPSDSIQVYSIYRYLENVVVVFYPFRQTVFYVPQQ